MGAVLPVVRRGDSAVSVNWGVLFVGVLILRALLLGVYISSCDLWKLSLKGLRELRG